MLAAAAQNPVRQIERWHLVGVAVLLVLLYTRVSDLPWLDRLPVSLTQVAVALVFGGILLERCLIHRQRLVWHPLLSWLLVYGAAIAVSIVGAVDRLASAAALIAYLREILIALSLVNLVSSAATLRAAIWSLAGGVGILATAAVVQALTGFDAGGLSTLAIQVGRDAISIRLDGPIGLDSNEFGRLLAMAAGLALYLTWTERRRWLRISALSLLVLVSVTAMWTFSRGGLAGLAFAIGVAALVQRRTASRLVVIGLLATAVVVGAPGLYWGRLGLTVTDVAILAAGRLPASDQPRPTPTAKSSSPIAGSAAAVIAAAEATQHDAPATSVAVAADVPARTGDSIFDRSSLMRVGLQMFVDRPLSGVGKGNYLAVYPQYSRRLDPNLPGVALGPHNTFIQIAAESGIPGLLTFVALLVAAGLTLRSARRRLLEDGREREALLLEGVGIAACAYVVTSMFLNDNVYQRYLWVLIGLIAAGDRLARRTAA